MMEQHIWFLSLLIHFSCVCVYIFIYIFFLQSTVSAPVAPTWSSEIEAIKGFSISWKIWFHRVASGPKCQYRSLPCPVCTTEVWKKDTLERWMIQMRVSTQCNQVLVKYWHTCHMTNVANLWKRVQKRHLNGLVKWYMAGFRKSVL